MTQKFTPEDHKLVKDSGANARALLKLRRRREVPGRLRERKDRAQSKVSADRLGKVANIIGNIGGTAGLLSSGTFLGAFLKAGFEDQGHNTVGDKIWEGGKALFQGHPVNPFVFVSGQNNIDADLKVMTIAALVMFPSFILTAIAVGIEEIGIAINNRHWPRRTSLK